MIKIVNIKILKKNKNLIKKRKILYEFNIRLGIKFDETELTNLCYTKQNIVPQYMQSKN